MPQHTPEERAKNRGETRRASLIERFMRVFREGKSADETLNRSEQQLLDQLDREEMLLKPSGETEEEKRRKQRSLLTGE